MLTRLYNPPKKIFEFLLGVHFVFVFFGCLFFFEVHHYNVVPRNCFLVGRMTELSERFCLFLFPPPPRFEFCPKGVELFLVLNVDVWMEFRGMKLDNADL